MYTKAFNNMVYRGNTRSNGDLIGGGSERPWTSQLTKAEYDISLSSQRLENVFRDVNRDSLQVGNGPHVPSPIKMIRRLTALEIAIGKLGQDCEMISEKRRNIVQSVIADQNQNIAKTIQVISTPSPIFSHVENLIYSRFTNKCKFLNNSTIIIIYIDTSNEKRYVGG